MTILVVVVVMVSCRYCRSVDISAGIGNITRSSWWCVCSCKITCKALESMHRRHHLSTFAAAPTSICKDKQKCMQQIKKWDNDKKIENNNKIIKKQVKFTRIFTLNCKFFEYLIMQYESKNFNNFNNLIFASFIYLCICLSSLLH